jgi:D-alanine transaminase
MSEMVYLNGEFVLKENAKISPNDRGFLFADGIYEVAKYYHGKPFRFDDHLLRLQRSLSEIGIDYKDTESLFGIFQKLIEKNNMLDKHAGVYVQITRGVHKRVHHFPENIQPTVYAYAFELPSFSQNLENGIKVITAEDIRWQRCDIKSVSLLPNTMLYNKAVQQGAGECILIKNGKVTEATHSSVLAVKNRIVYTHPATNLILPGITRKVILEICAANGIEVREQAITETQLYEMEEIIIAGTGSEVTPAIRVNDKIVGKNKPGEITRFIQQKFFEMV